MGISKKYFISVVVGFDVYAVVVFIVIVVVVAVVVERTWEALL